MLERRTFIAALTASALAARPAIARQDSFGSEALHRGRATVAVFINDQGPFQFIIDTAANSSVIADDLVAPLGLSSIGNIGMHTLVGREVVPAVRGRRVRSGALDARDVRFAVGSRGAIADLDGLLGCDLLVDTKVVLNFRGGGVQRTRIVRSSAPARGILDRRDTETPFVARGERQFGNLLVIPARIGTTQAQAIIDSGAEGTILNRAAALAGRAVPLRLADGQTRWRIQSPTGEATAGELMVLPLLDIAGMTISDLPIVVGDFHTFRIAGLGDQPAMLVGLDVFRLFDAVHIDLKRSEFSVRS